MKYLALLRGINVGGNNIVKMAELRTCLECVGFKRVSTYIQSGNVLFESGLKSPAKLSLLIEQALSEKLLKTQQVLVVAQQQLCSVVEDAPSAFGADLTKYRYDVIFVKPPLSPQALLPAIPLKNGVDEASESSGVIYFKRLTARASESQLLKLMGNPAYKNITVRNWSTTTKLYQLMNSAST